MIIVCNVLLTARSVLMAPLVQNAVLGYWCPICVLAAMILHMEDLLAVCNASSLIILSDVQVAAICIFLTLQTVYANNVQPSSQAQQDVETKKLQLNA